MTVKLVAGRGIGLSGSLDRDALMPPRLEDGRQPGLIPADGARLAAGPRNVGTAARRVRTLPRRHAE